MSSSAKPAGALNVLQIIDALPDLNKSDLRLLLNVVEKELDKYVEIDRELYHLVFEVVGVKPIAISKFAPSADGAEWRKNFWAFIEIEKKLGVYGPNPPRQGVRLALRKFLVELLIEDMKAIRKPITLKNVCIHLGQMLNVFDRQFPGYLKNGWGGAIIAQLGGNNGKTEQEL